MTEPGTANPGADRRHPASGLVIRSPLFAAVSTMKAAKKKLCQGYKLFIFVLSLYLGPETVQVSATAAGNQGQGQ